MHISELLQLFKTRNWWATDGALDLAVSPQRLDPQVILAPGIVTATDKVYVNRLLLGFGRFWQLFILKLYTFRSIFNKNVFKTF